MSPYSKQVGFTPQTETLAGTSENKRVWAELAPQDIWQRREKQEQDLTLKDHCLP